MRRSKTFIISLLAIALLLGLVFYQYGYLKIQGEIQSVKEDEEIKAKILQRNIELIAEKPLLEKKFASLTENRKADNAKLVEGQTLSLAAASLQDTVKGIISTSGGSISSERVGKPEDVGKFKAITVSIDALVPDARALGDILYSLETRTPSLVIKELDVRVRDFRNPRELMVKLDISAMTSGK